MKLVRFNVTFFDGGKPKYDAGRHYPINEETERCVAQGIAELVESNTAVAQAEKLAEKARKAAEAAAEAAKEAALRADAARVAQAEADRAQDELAAAAAADPTDAKQVVPPKTAAPGNAQDALEDDGDQERHPAIASAVNSATEALNAAQSALSALKA